MTKHILGQSTSRIDGLDKVTGRAQYTADFSLPGQAHAFAVRATIGHGEVLSISDEFAQKVPGYLGLLSHENKPVFDGIKHPPGPPTRPDAAIRYLLGPKVEYFGQFIGVVMAESYEAARQAASLVKVSYKTNQVKADLDRQLSKAFRTEKINVGKPSDTLEGQPHEKLEQSDFVVRAHYRTPMEHHHPLEPHAILTHWQDDELLFYYPAQILSASVSSLAKTFELPKDKIRVLAPFVGGGFGGKLNLPAASGLAVIAAKHLGRPIKMVLTRQQLFTDVGLRQENRMKLSLGADKEGRIKSLIMNSVTHTAPYRTFIEQTGAHARMMYEREASEITHRVTHLHTHAPNRMRAPGEATGSFAVESCMDELACKMGIDPIILRERNEPSLDLETGKPWSSRAFPTCLTEGAKAFGWAKRSTLTRQQKRDNYWIGYGVAGSARGAPHREASAKATLSLVNNRVRVLIALAATDSGTGSYTIIAQTAAQRLQIEMSQVQVVLGDSDFPPTPGSGGSWGAASFSCATDAVCEKVLKILPPGPNLEARLSQVPDQTLSVLETEKPHPDAERYSKYGFGAHFCEVWVDEDLGKIRIPRFHSSIAGGYILNPKTARSQIIGGIVWGISQALFEESILDHRYGSWITRSLENYHIPVNLDIGDIDVQFVDDPDPIVNRLGVKGIGELGIVGVAACVSNAIYNATGRRCRSLPITPEKLLETEIT